MGRLRLFFISWLVMSVPVLAAEEAPSAESELYYAAAEPFQKAKNVELRLTGGADVSNPMVNIYGVTLGGYYLAKDWLAFGLEGTAFNSSTRIAAHALSSMIETYGYRVGSYSPDYSAVGVVRVTPIIGMVNWFSNSILAVELSAMLRAGAIHYQQRGVGMLLGAGLDVHVRISETFGVNLAVQGSSEQIGPTAWVWRTGISAGPSVRF